MHSNNVVIKRTIQAKPVIYRSKLEHEWALAFARAGEDVVYEPGYFNSWLPDFEHVGYKRLYEIKPTFDIAQEEIPRIFNGLMVAAEEGYRPIVLIGSPTSFALYYLGFDIDVKGLFSSRLIGKGLHMVDLCKLELFEEKIESDNAKYLRELWKICLESAPDDMKRTKDMAILRASKLLAIEDDTYILSFRFSSLMNIADRCFAQKLITHFRKCSCNVRFVLQSDSLLGLVGEARQGT